MVSGLLFERRSLGNLLTLSLARRNSKHEERIMSISKSWISYRYSSQSTSEFKDSFKSSDIKIVKCSVDEYQKKPNIDKLAFGQFFTDHMFLVDFDPQNGWSRPLITKVQSLNIHPGAKVLHYALEAFDGARAFRGHDNKIRFFRLNEVIQRHQRSAMRLSLPSYDRDEFVKCIHKLVHLEQDWIPEKQRSISLYIRPTILGVEPSLGVANSDKAILYTLLSPLSSQIDEYKPISVYADPNFVRTWPGGVGDTKLSSNYAPTVMVQRQAEERGLQQVLWLYGDDHRLTEVGDMNIFVTIKGTKTDSIHLITPPLSDGLISPGIIRDSILNLASQWSDVNCEERYLTLHEIEQLIHEDKVIEMFGSSTACVVCPIDRIQMNDGRVLCIPSVDFTKTLDSGPSIDSHGRLSLANRILRTISDIQHGKVPHHWAEELQLEV